MKGKLSAPLLALALLAHAFAPEVWAQRRTTTRRGAQRGSPRASAGVGTASADARLRQLADEYLRGHFAFNPTEATAAGLHEYDAQLESRSAQSIEGEARRLRTVLAALARIPEWRLSPEARYDFLVLRSHARARLLDLEEFHAWQRDPGLYSRTAAAAVDNVLKREYAPGEQRLDVMLARERQIPRLLVEARLNLQNPPRLFTETAIADARGAIDFFTGVVPQLIERAGGGRLTAARRAEINATNESVVEALRSYAAWLERDLLPRSAGDPRLGAEGFRLKLLHEEMIDTPLASIEREAEEEVRLTHEAMRAAAEDVAPGRGVVAALQLLERERPAAAGLVGEARAELGRIRAFVAAEELVSLPASENLVVAETPEYERALGLAALDVPGPFERASAEAFYYVTPPDSSWDAARADEYLAQFNRYALPIISVGEVYPGRYYQQLALRRNTSRLRAALAARAFAEGWGRYCEQMMLDEGFGGNNPRLRLAQLHSSLVGLCRLLASVRAHAAGMTYEQAVEFLAREAHLPRANAEREARRVLLDPSSALGSLGKAEIVRLRDEWRRQMGDSFRLGDFHDRLLSYGRPPVRVLRMAMLGDAGDGRKGENGVSAAQGEGQSVPVDFSVLGTGTMSGYEGPRRIELVTSEDEWRRAWEVIGGGRPVPDVNFNTSAVVNVFQGQQRSGGYGIEVVSVRRVGTVLAVKVNERRPASGDITIQALTSPFVAVSIPRPPPGTTVRFDESGAVEAKVTESKGVTKPRVRGARRRGRRRP